MKVFVDTSGTYALLDAGNVDYSAALDAWTQVVHRGHLMVTSLYVVVETCALLQKRFGISAVRKFLGDVLPAIMIEWVDVNLHTVGINGVLTSARSGPSLVDCVSFAIMRQLGIQTAFTFDRHFQEQGFDCKPHIA